MAARGFPWSAFAWLGVAALVVSPVACMRIRQARATRLWGGLVASARAGGPSPLGLAGEDAAELAASRAWPGEDFEVACDLTGSPVTFNRYACQAWFTNGGGIFGDVDAAAGQIRSVHVAQPSGQR